MKRRSETQDAIARVRRAVGKLRIEGLALSESAECVDHLVSKVPPWIARCTCIADGTNTWLYCEPDPQAEYSHPSQVMLDLPGGNYLIDTFDAAAHECVARESAQAPPLVAGLTHTGTKVLLWIRSSRPDA